MKRTFLEELKLDKDTIDKIMDENGRDIEKAKGDLETVTKERDGLKEQIADRDKQLDKLKKSTGDVEELKKQIADLQKDSKSKLDALEAENKSIRINSAIDRALSRSGARNNAAVKALLKDIDKAELQDDGTIKGLDSQIKALQKSDSYLFNLSDSSQHKLKGVKPGEAGDNKPAGIDAKQFARMGYRERLKLHQEDPDTYNALAGKE